MDIDHAPKKKENRAKDASSKPAPASTASKSASVSETKTIQSTKSNLAQKIINPAASKPALPKKDAQAKLNETQAKVLTTSEETTSAQPVSQSTATSHANLPKPAEKVAVSSTVSQPSLATAALPKQNTPAPLIASAVPAQIISWKAKPKSPAPAPKVNCPAPKAKDAVVDLKAVAAKVGVPIPTAAKPKIIAKSQSPVPPAQKAQTPVAHTQKHQPASSAITPTTIKVAPIPAGARPSDSPAAKIPQVAKADSVVAEKTPDAPGKFIPADASATHAQLGSSGQQPVAIASAKVVPAIDQEAVKDAPIAKASEQANGQEDTKVDSGDTVKVDCSLWTSVSIDTGADSQVDKPTPSMKITGSLASPSPISAVPTPISLPTNVDSAVAQPAAKSSDPAPAPQASSSATSSVVRPII